MRLAILTLALLATLATNAKTIEDFNFNWRFSLDKQQAAHQLAYNDSHWQTVRLPHDWSVALPYTEKGAASTGFKLGGTGWYRKTFKLPSKDQHKVIWLEFDGIYNNAEIWVNGHFVAERPYGYTSFNVDLSPHLYFGEQENLVAVKVNRQAFADSRWYTGSGIYRNVRLVKANTVYIPQWGIQVTSPEVDTKQAKVTVKTQVKAKQHLGETANLQIKIQTLSGQIVATQQTDIKLDINGQYQQQLTVANPNLWSLTNPNLYIAEVSINHQGKQIAHDKTRFGIRSIRFDSNTGFWLNNKNVKIKGVNLHHDAGAIGAAVPKSVWADRLAKLKSVGVNALRLSHNPHSPELLELADEMGFVVNAEAFDDWDRAKGKSKVYLGDNAAKGDMADSYAEHFNVWAERDLKDFIKRDFNHPSIIMWSIGNEVEWTYPYYPKSVSHHEDGTSYYEDAPDFDRQRIMNNIKKFNPDQVDNLAIIAHQLSAWVKETDTTRPVTAGLTHPSVGFATGYADALDLVGFNYRAAAYAKAHETYPDKVIYGSENWGAWREWRDVKNKDYIAGIFIWTGFAYKGEAGPLPRMGLNISLFDFAGFKTPRGHFFEALWTEKPKIWLGTTPVKTSEFSLNDNNEWSFTPRKPAPNMWDKLRMWEWYDVEPLWRYQQNENIVVQTYTNAQSAELFLNGRSLGKKQLADFDDQIIKWLVPYQDGELKVIGYQQGKPVSQAVLNTPKPASKVTLTTKREQIKADHYDTSFVYLHIQDEDGTWISDAKQEVEFIVEGPANLMAVDNGSEYNVQNVLSNRLMTDRGRAALLLQSNGQPGQIKVQAKWQGKLSKPVYINAK
ncbi:sugar-binding domain-containing protein [Gayadomonas joobiniege]|uniref:sugar-binding domain-containing protein n=1 Tax=Gayadomonas joobiniege TaxID=1234606 RepID=UPI000362F249|nr:sugar-binding domain-containing protein [Gayadomonas joobiniege]